MKQYKDSLHKYKNCMQERMNYLNDSGEFHEVESNNSGHFSHVPSQPARIPSPRSMLSCDKRLQPETWNPSGLQKSVFANSRSTLKSLQRTYRGIHPFMTPNAAGQVPALISTGKPVAREDERIGSTIPMPTFARRPPTMSSFVPVDISQSSMVGQKDSRYRNFNFDKYTTAQSFFMLEDKIPQPSGYLFLCFSRRQYYGSRKWRWSIRWTI